MGAEKILCDSLQLWTQSQIHDYLHQHEVRWSFNPSAASHVGGAWARLICSTRHILFALIKEQVVTDEVLNTLMTEVESILNSRPLVPVTFGADNKPLRPNYLLLLRGSINLLPGLFDKRDSYAQREWFQTQYFANEFWRRWVREFLPKIT